MNRRAFVKGGAAASVALSTGGCLGVGPFAGSAGATDDVVLDEPDQYETLRESRDSGGLVYPIHGDPLPEATVPAPLHDREVSTREFVGDRHALVTFIFTRCPNTCQLLTQALRHVQDESVEQGFTEEVAFMPMTFDPENDTPEVLREHGDRRGVNWDARNWFYLRPDGPDRATEVIDETFGIGFQKLSPEEREERDLGEEMYFIHTTTIMLANKDGYIERTFKGRDASPVNVVEAFNTLRERW
jgi:protein SCO1/2